MARTMTPPLMAEEEEVEILHGCVGEELLHLAGFWVGYSGVASLTQKFAQQGDLTGLDVAVILQSLQGHPVAPQLRHLGVDSTLCFALANPIFLHDCRLVFKIFGFNGLIKSQH